MPHFGYFYNTSSASMGYLEEVVKGILSGSMKMLIIKLGKRRNVMIGTDKHFKERIIVSTHGLEIKPTWLAKKPLETLRN